MSGSVEGKTAIVTGGGSGINLSFVRLLLSKGCSVVIADLALRSEAEPLLTQYPRTTGKPSCHFHRTDVSSWPALTSLWDYSARTFPQGVDIVVCGAGLFEPPSSSFWNAPRSATNPESPSRDDAHGEPGHYAQLDVNLVSPMRLSQLAIAHWTQEKRKGCLIHVGSIAGYASTLASPIYHASKYGLLGFVRSLGSLRDEVGIRVSYVAPAQVRTPMWQEDAHKSGLLTEDAEFVEPEEIAEAMLDLVVDEKLGDGTVYEVTKGKRRVVPPYNADPPSGYGLKMSGYAQENERVMNKLRKGDFKI